VDRPGPDRDIETVQPAPALAAEEELGEAVETAEPDQPDPPRPGTQGAEPGLRHGEGWMPV
jgi:hypothetical protein